MVKKRGISFITTLVFFFAIFFVLVIRVSGQTSDHVSAGDIYQIASLSAQVEPVKIDPGFSYEEGRIIYEAPSGIIIPSLNIDIPVKPAPIVDGYWLTATDSASFGLGSAYPSQKGNTVIFAHATDKYFANLNRIQPDAAIYVLTKSGWYIYKVQELKTVLPTAVEVISPTTDKTLTLYTCTGYRDVYRFVVVAKPAI